MPSTDAASSTLVLPRATARVAGLSGLDGPERSAPPSFRVFVDPGASTPISNPVLSSLASGAPSRPLFGSLMPACAAPHPQAGRGQPGEDAAHGRAGRGGVHGLPVAPGGAAGHHRGVTAVGGEGIGVARSLARLARLAGLAGLVAVLTVLAVVLLLVFRRDLAQARRH